MAKVITFSRVFPSYHPKKGEPTYFEYKIARSLYDLKLIDDSLDPKYHGLLAMIAYGHIPKHHTIRAGQRWKAGDWFSPRVWSGKPYRSKMITIAPDIQIKKVYDFEIKSAFKRLPLDYDTDIMINHRYYNHNSEIIKEVAKNDGLSIIDLLKWFKYPAPFQGQIICWNENIEY